MSALHVAAKIGATDVAEILVLETQVDRQREAQSPLDWHWCGDPFGQGVLGLTSTSMTHRAAQLLRLPAMPFSNW